MQQLCEPYRIRYVLRGQHLGSGGGGGAPHVLHKQGRPQGFCFPLDRGTCACGCFLSWPWVGPAPPPPFWTHSHLVWGWGQVSIQSADAQEQVEGLLAENSALRTSLAALEQVEDSWEPLLDPLQLPVSSCF